LKVAHKVMLIVVVMLLLLIFVGNLIFSVIFNRYLIKQESDQIEMLFGSTATYFEEKQAKYCAAALDWAQWDLTYDYIQGADFDYMGENIDEGTYENLDINFMMLIDDDNTVMEKGYFDFIQGAYTEFPMGLYENILAYLPIYKSDSKYSSIVKADDRYFIIASAIITDSLNSKPGRGVMVIGREIDGSILGTIESVTDSKIRMVSPQDIDVEVLHSLMDQGDGRSKVYVSNAVDRGTVVGQILLSLRDGTQPAILQFTKERDIFAFGSAQQKIFQIIYTSFVLGIALLMFLATRGLLLSFNGLIREIAGIDVDKGKLTKLSVRGSDEFGQLAEAVNRMLDRILSEHEKLKKSEKRLLTAQSIAHVGNWEFNISNHTIWFSKEAFNVLGICRMASTITTSEFERSLTPEDYGVIRESIREMIGGNRCTVLETKYTRLIDGTERILRFQAEPEYDVDGNLVKILGVVMDITSEKLKEADIIYLSHHDTLTGLYNRFFFEEELKRLEGSRQLPLSIIMGDINGLKLINDAFGHAEGDMLLTNTADILRQCSRAEDIVARLGGDEFCIVLPNTTAETAQQICRRIYGACKEFNQKSDREYSFVSISLGTGTKVSHSQCMDFIIREAEEAMYKHKLLDRKSMHSSIMTSIKATMVEKSFETQEHGDRLVRLSNRVGRAMNLTDDQFNDLELLATLHDIGKIGIDSAILSKAGPLTDEEWVEMKRHPEIGFRIAAVSTELASISEYILCHHERWDGKGYPQGLEGYDIPILSRIIAIVDSYDAMTQDRPYRKAMSREEAIIELRKNAGTQFDPEIVELFIKYALGEKSPKTAFKPEIRLVPAGQSAPDLADANQV